MHVHGLTSMQDFGRHRREEAPITRRAERIWPMVLGWGILAILFGAIGAFVVAIALDSGDPKDREAFFAGLAIVVFALILIGSIVVIAVNNRRRWAVRRDAAAMALGQGWHYELEVDPRHFTGSLFRAGSRGRAESAMHTHDPGFVEVGNYTFTAGAGQSFKGVDQVGYVRMLLDRELPHISLHAQGRTKPRPYAFDRVQRIDLEGDFIRYWRLFVPQGYGEDAYYVFTPDLMQTLVDTIPGCDVEIVGQELYVYGARPFDLTTPAILDAALAVRATVGKHTSARTSRYDRVVEPAAMRLGPAATWALRIIPAAAAAALLLILAAQAGVLG